MAEIPFQRKPVERVPGEASEARLLELRRRAEITGRVELDGVHPAGAPFPAASAQNGYYSLPLLKHAGWKWSVPVYLFAGGVAGSAALMAAAARWLTGDARFERDARYVAAAGAVLSPALLVYDLGRKSRFLAMLRVFKPQSAMSVGSWTLFLFGNTAGAAAFAAWLEERYGVHGVVRALGNMAQSASAALGVVMATYTGVLLGATAIPAWNRNIAILPVHFAASGMLAAASTLELMENHPNPALHSIAMGASAVETAMGAHLETKRDPALRPLRTDWSGFIIRTGGVLSGPLPLALRLLALRGPRRRAERLDRMASACGVAGSILTRVGWVMAARASAADNQVTLELSPQIGGLSAPAAAGPGSTPVAMVAD